MTKRKQTAVAVETMDEGLVITFASGTRKTLAVAQLSADIQARAMLHGLKQKLVDAAAMPCNPDTGRPASVEEKEAAVLAVLERLQAGEWNKNREGDGTGGGGLLFKALCRIQPNKTPDAIRAFMDGLTDKQKTQLRTKNPRVVEAINAIQAEKAGGIDGDDLLAGLIGE